MTENTTPPQQTKKRWLWPLLFTSLAVNLLIIGIVAGLAMQRGGDDGRNVGPARSLMGEPFVRALKPNDRMALGRDILSKRDQLRENRTDLRHRVEILLETIGQEEFDRAAVSKLLAEQRSLAVSRQQIGEELLLNRLEGMSVEERRAYADRLGKSLKRFRRD